ncbi:hypothetical protein VTN00DRAFT_130 [Thermoascus crustaceus]|uniref:uncharacterized protein n=1 Tax=Thermoascus crustaceus TaxID=5088 RepID=UPI0037423A01
MTSSWRAPSRKLDDFEAPIYEFFNQLVELNSENESWDIDANRCQLRFEYATRGPPPRVSYLLNVTSDLCNRMGNLHGGCAATLIDNLSTTILVGISRPGHFSLGGVSRNLKVTYLRPVPQDIAIRIICEMVHAGKRLALLRAEIRRADNNDICVVGEHEKANTDSEITQKM